MRIVVTVKTRAREAGLEKVDDGHYKARVVAAPEGGRANAAVIALLADYFSVPKSSVSIIMGKTHTEKLIEIPG